MLKKFLIMLVCIVIPFSAVGCRKGPSSGGAVDVPKAEQFTPPAKGDKIAVMKTSMGDIKIKLFPNEAPKAVENFIKYSKDGYQDLTFFCVMNDFMIQGGDPLGVDVDLRSMWYPDEVSANGNSNLHNYRGAIAMANNGPNTYGRQFFIVQAPAKTISSETESYMKEYKFSEDVIEKYKEVGGIPSFDYKALSQVFGQVYEGMDIVDKIAAVEVDSNDKPTKDVKILGIEITIAE